MTVINPTTGSGGGSAATDTIYDAKGDLVVGTGADTAARKAVGANDTVLTADSAQATGVKWATPAAATTVANDTIWDTKGDIVAATGADAATKLAAGSNGQALTAQSGQATGLQWATLPTVATDVIFDAKGDLPVGTGADTAAKLTVGSNGQMLVADSSQTTGVKWVDRAVNPTLMMPLGYPFLPTGTVNPVAFRYYFTRFVAPKTGTLAGVAALIGTASGNMEVGVYDTGDASAGNATRLHDSGSIAVPAAGYKEVATPNVSLVAGQHFIVVLQVDNATAALGRQLNSSGNGSPTILPTGYAVAAGGLAAKMMGTAGTPGALSMPSTIAEATFIDPSNVAVLTPICRMT